jgi:hypothetical protein
MIIPTTAQIENRNCVEVDLGDYFEFEMALGSNRLKKLTSYVWTRKLMDRWRGLVNVGRQSQRSVLFA